jgi:hypothetical protein
MRTTIPNCIRCFTSRRLFLPFATVALITFVLGLYPQRALAQSPSNPGGGVDDSNGVFQLEGNATTDAGICFGIGANGPVIATPGTGNSCPSGESIVTFSGSEDWDKIYLGTTTATASTGIINDPFNTRTDNTLCGGSTKDTLDFSQWKFCEGTPQDKDDFEHGYAAAYTRSSDGHTIIVAGVDRYSNSGSSTAGFWFVQDPDAGANTVDASGNPVNCTVSSGCPFGGTHKKNDLLIISQFTTGGTVSTIQVFHWTADGTAGSIGNPDSSGTQCDPRSGSTTLCGTVNGVPVLTGGWAFSSKPSVATGCSSTGTGSGSVKTNCMSTGEFLEIGFDLTAYATNVLGGQAPCISRFFAESRASGTGTTSTLSDFITPHKFPLCTLTATKSCSGASFINNGTAVKYDFTGTINATGGTFTSVSVSDTPNPPNGTGISNVNTVGPCSNAGPYNQQNPCTSATTVTPSTTLYYAGSFDSTTESSTLPNTATVSGVTPESETQTTTASWPTPLTGVCAPSPTGTLALTKSCFVTRIDSNLAIHVHFTGTVTNNATVQVSNITVTDTPDGGTGATALSGVTLNPGGVANFSGDYTATQCAPINSNPALPLGGFTIEDNGRCKFDDTVTATGTGALGYSLPSVPANQAFCNLCPAGTDTNGTAYCGNP